MMDPIFNLPKTPPRAIDIGRYERHPSHFYDDGNVIFIAENTVFKLYQGIFARQSTPISEILASPQMVVTTNIKNDGSPNTSADTLAEDQDPGDDNTRTTEDGLPVILLKESAYDFAIFIDFFFPQSSGITKHRPFGTFPNPEELLKIIQISSKFSFKECHERAIEYLNSDIPLIFEDYVRSKNTHQSFKFWADVINTPELEHLRPIAFYELSIMAEIPGNGLETSSALSLADTARLVRGIHRIQEWLVRTIHELVPKHCRGVYYPAGGAQDQPVIQKFFTTYRPDPIRSLSGVRMSSKVCDNCFNEARKFGIREARIFFEDLVLYFDL